MSDTRTETGLSPAANDIFLTVTSDGSSYQDRLSFGRRQKDNPQNALTQQRCARFWADLAGKTAESNHHKFAIDGSNAPTVAEILEAAAALAADCQRHLMEL